MLKSEGDADYGDAEQQSEGQMRENDANSAKNQPDDVHNGR